MKTCILTLFVTACVCHAAIRFVTPGESIQSAVLESSDLDTVIIEDGFYTETVIPYGRTLTIGSRFLLDSDTAHISATLITPDSLRPDTGSCFVYAYDESPESRLVGLTLRDGAGTNWISSRV